MVARVAHSEVIDPKTSLLFHPLKWTAEKVQFAVKKIFGFFLRLSVFQLGEYKKPFAYFWMRLFQKISCDPREDKPVSRERLELSKNLLLQFGGVESVVIPADKTASVRLMILKAADFFAKIDQLGGEKVLIRRPDGSGGIRSAIIAKPGTSPEDFQDLCQKLGKFFLPTIAIMTGEGRRTGILLPHSPALAHGQAAPMVVRFHSPGRSMVMDRKFIGNHLGGGYDICISDPRGTIDSTGTPSEGGYYLDAEAVLDHVVAQGYPYDGIYISGYCEGAAIGAHLKKKYHREGIHYIAENPFNSLLDTVFAHNFVGRWTGHHAISEIKSTDPQVTRRVAQDGFNNTAKFEQLPRATGKAVIIHTDTDRTNPPHSIPEIRKALGDAGPYVEILRNHPDPRVNGHMQPPTEDPTIWKQYVAVVN